MVNTVVILARMKAGVPFPSCKAGMPTIEAANARFAVTGRLTRTLPIRLPG